MVSCRKIKDKVHCLSAIDWDRRLFDSLIPLPDGTSYNAYLVEGSEKTVLLDTADPSMHEALIDKLGRVPAIDFVVSLHAEQDHSGSIPMVIEKYPEAKVVCSTKAKGMLADHLRIPAERVIIMEDGQALSLGDKTLKFIYTPWVHWPETMSAFLEEDNILFSCDFFGSHLATGDLFAKDEGRVYEAAKRYYAEIMMPFRQIINKNLEKLADYRIELIAPSHGPLYGRPAFILDAYRDWAADEPKNLAVIPYVSMHGSTRKLIDHLVNALIEQNVGVQQFDLAQTDIGKLAASLVDAATIVIGAPTVLTGPHPLAAYCAFLANALRPKAKFVSIVGSYGWGGKTVETLAGIITNLKVEILAPVLCKGLPTENDFKALEDLAAAIVKKHKEIDCA